MENLLYAVPVIGVVALAVALMLKSWIGKQDEGNDRMKEISGYIREGAMAFLGREYKMVAAFAVVLLLIVAIFISPIAAIACLFGAAFSVLAGFIGMKTATDANVRTTNAASKNGMPAALKVAFRGGAVMGLCVVGLGLLGVSVVFIICNLDTGIFANITLDNCATIITGFSLGASFVALFGRVGGGIYTKAADVGADLVGKVEAGIPEDDPRNPAVIADNVGDNVGDVAGMGSDLFESYVGSIVSAITLAIAIPTINSGLLGEVALDPVTGSLFPLFLAAIGIIASIIAVFFVNGKTNNPASQLNLGTYISSAIVIVASFFLSQACFGNIGAFVAVVIGLVVGVAIGKITEFYTSGDFKPVKEIAQQCETGSATCIISGFATGLTSTVFPLLLIAIAILGAYYAFGLYGIAIAAVGMLSTTGIVIAVDAYGPISDNAGGIAEMSELPEEVREITDTLDSVGNTTAAVGKGFAVGSAALTALALFVSYSQIANLEKIDLLSPAVVAGLLIGGMLPMLFSALTMNSVGKAANQMIEEVRRQFHEFPGIMEGTQKPDYARCVDISTGAALKEMLLPGALAVVCPIAVGLILGTEALGGLLAGSLVVGVLMAITMSNAGGAWDNAKKYIENGHNGGKGSEPHKAAVVGDTVGDPFKDTSGPSLNILIKLMTVVAVVFLPLFL
ncbi:MAG: sodium-translocating pyrophosphatase [Oscillospiraceae bacterium]|nr:sodium-translocating pyrophosphatase [Oscillospiraceae bacterium]MBQ5327567.1 sodium-translocating pyrophosphatase [Oscillospiraceae bacterium]MBQ8595629.1 sodium-translocating pyrophosphatase [Oscillospiraceae bacterium]